MINLLLTFPLGPSTVFWVAVVACTVVISPAHNHHQLYFLNIDDRQFFKEGWLVRENRLSYRKKGV
jgi:hypothetical protein